MRSRRGNEIPCLLALTQFGCCLCRHWASQKLAYALFSSLQLRAPVLMLTQPWLTCGNANESLQPFLASGFLSLNWEHQSLWSGRYFQLYNSMRFGPSESKWNEFWRVERGGLRGETLKAGGRIDVNHFSFWTQKSLQQVFGSICLVACLCIPLV